MKRKLLYLVSVLLTTAMLTMPISCTDDSEESAESLAKKFCDCEKIEDRDKREKCIDNVNYELRFHIDDAAYMAAYNKAAQACYN